MSFTVQNPFQPFAITRVDVAELNREFSLIQQAFGRLIARGGQGALQVNIDDGSLSLAKLAPGTPGSVVGYTTDGTPAEIAPGTAGYVLTSHGPGTPPTFTAVASGAGNALTANPLSQFAATTSLQLKGVISDETGSGALVFATGCTLVTPALGVATATSINKLTITQPASGATLTIADGKTLTVSNNATVSGTNTGDQATPTGTGFRHVTSGVEDSATKLVDLSDLAPQINGDILGFGTAGAATGISPIGAGALLVSNGFGTIPSFAFVNGVTLIADGALPVAKLSSTTSSELAGVISDETGSGALVFANTPTLVTPVLGNALATTINGVTINPATPIGATLSIDDGFVLHVIGNASLSGTHTGASSGSNTGDVANTALTTGKLSQFAATSSSELAGVISDETGTGALVFATSPALVTPTLGVASATTVNKVTITAPATGSTLTIADGKTLTVSNNATVSGTNTGDQTVSTMGASGALTDGTGTLLLTHGGTGATDAAGARSNLGLGTMATQSASAVVITGGEIAGIFDLSVNDGGTGASTAIAAADHLSTKSSNIASATTTDLSTATGTLAHITGTTTITGFGTVAAGAERVLVFDGILTLTHNSTSLILPGAANIITGAGDMAVMRSEGSGNWRCAGFVRAAVAPGTAGSASWSGSSISTTIGVEDDWAPTGYADALVFNITGTGGYLRGIQGGIDGRIIVIRHSGSSGSILVQGEATSSTAANRFAEQYSGLGSSYYGPSLSPGQAAVFRYNGTLSRWVSLVWASMTPTGATGDFQMAYFTNSLFVPSFGSATPLNGYTYYPNNSLTGGGFITNARIQEHKGASVASANDLVLPGWTSNITTDAGNVYLVTGTTTIKDIDATGWQSGSRVRLTFDSTITIQDGFGAGAPYKTIYTKSGSNLELQAGEFLTLLYDGTSWNEV